MARSYVILALVALLAILPHVRAGPILFVFSFDSNTIPLSTDIVFSSISGEDLPEAAADHPTAILAESPAAPNVYERFPSLMANKDADDVCLYIGVVGGCSACEHDTLGACAWLSDPDFQLKGVCVSQDSADVITTSGRSVRLAWPVPMLELNGLVEGEGASNYLFGTLITGTIAAIETSADGSSGPKVEAYLNQKVLDLSTRFNTELNAESVIIYQTLIIDGPIRGAGLCPAPGSGEPELTLRAPPYFASASKSSSSYAEAGYCLNKGSDLPSNQQTIHYGDRFSAESALYTIFDYPIDRCASINTRNPARPEFVTGFYGSEPIPTEYVLNPTWTCEEEVKASPQEMECLALMKKIECNKYCDPYGKFVSPTLCPDSFLHLIDICGSFVDGEKMYGNCPSLEYFTIALIETLFDLEDDFIAFLETGVFSEFDGECFDLRNNAFYEVNSDALFNDMNVVPGETDPTLDECDTMLPLFGSPDCEGDIFIGGLLRV